MALGGNVHQIGPLQRPQRLQLAARGQAQLQVRVARNRHAAQQHVAVLAVRPDVTALARAHQLHIVPALAQAQYHALQRERHAVDLGRVGLGDDGDAQMGLRGGQVFDQQVGGVGLHAAIVGSIYLRTMTTSRGSCSGP